MKWLLSKLGLFSVVWSGGSKFDIKNNTPYRAFTGWRIVYWDKAKARPFIYVSRCTDLRLYLDNGPQDDGHYTWFPEKPGKCTCCKVHKEKK